MNQPFSGGWRFGDRPTSVEALYQPRQIDNEFLKRVSQLTPEEEKPALEQALTADPLQGLLDAPGSAGWGNDASQDGSRARTGDVQGFNGSLQAAANGLLGQKIGSYANMFDKLTGKTNNAPVSDIYGVSPQAIQTAQAQQMAQLADQYAQYNNPNAGLGGGLLGDVSFGGSGDFGLGAGVGGSFGDYGSNLGGAAGLGLDPGNIGTGFGDFGGMFGGGDYGDSFGGGMGGYW